MPEDPYENEPTHESSDSDAYLVSGEDTPQPPPQAIPASRVVYCTSCGIQLSGLSIGEPCPNCQVPVGSAAKNSSKTNGSAIAALVLGICSFAACVLYGLPGIVCAILAIIFAGKVRRGVASGEIHASSLGMANAGRICGIVSLCLSTLFMLAIIAWFVFLFAVMVPKQQQMNQQLQQQMNQQMQQQSPSGYTVPAQPTPATQPDVAEPETPETNP